MRYCFDLSDELKQLAQQAAHDREFTLADWIRQSMYAYLRTAKSNKPKYKPKEKWPSGYPKQAMCFHCKSACHDPGAEHGYLPEEIGEYELAYASQHPCV